MIGEWKAELSGDNVRISEPTGLSIMVYADEWAEFSKLHKLIYARTERAEELRKKGISVKLANEIIGMVKING